MRGRQQPNPAQRNVRISSDELELQWNKTFRTLGDATLVADAPKQGETGGRITVCARLQSHIQPTHWERTAT